MRWLPKVCLPSYLKGRFLMEVSQRRLKPGLQPGAGLLLVSGLGPAFLATVKSCVTIGPIPGALYND